VSLLCLGEILFDCLGSLRLPGGAPANVACHAAALGREAVLLSRVGDDADGSRLKDWLREKRISSELLQTDLVHPTGTVKVEAGPRYEIEVPAAWDFIEISPVLIDAASRSAAVVFGSLAQRQPVSRRTIRAAVGASRAARVPVLCDLNLREPWYDEEIILWSLRNCDLLKLNLDELAVVSRLLQARGEPADLFAGLLREFAIPRGVLTCGAEGAWCVEDGATWHEPAVATTPVGDAVGAGDAFTAVLALGVTKGLSLRKAAPAAAALAAYVCSQAGATPELPEKLVCAIKGMLAS